MKHNYMHMEIYCSSGLLRASIKRGRLRECYDLALWWSAVHFYQACPLENDS